MSKSSSDSRRLHPKLRVFANGSAVVNDCRSKISTNMCSGFDDIEESVERQAEDKNYELSLLQRSLPGLNYDVNSADLSFKSALSKRKKLKGQKLAADQYVNVTLEVVAHGQENDEEATTHAVSRLAGECTKKLFKASKLRAPGSVIVRQNLISATVPVTYLEELKSNKDVAFVHPSNSLKLDLPTGDNAGRPKKIRINEKGKHREGKDVIIGIVDVGGFQFSHPDFIEGGKTRFTRIWDQGSTFRPSPDKFGYGAEFTDHHLNAAIAAEARPGGLPASWLEPQSQVVEGSHGTHVAGIAAGKYGICPKAEIAAVLVDVPLANDEFERRRFTFSDSSRIVHAVEYLIDYAKSRNKPVSINISLGTNGGPHDGSNGVSRWLDLVLSVPGRSICVAAGNSGQEKAEGPTDMGWIMGRIHSSGRIESRGLDAELNWIVVGNGIVDISENELEIWYSAQDRFAVEVLPPGETDWLKVKPQEFIENKRLQDGTTVSIYNELYHPYNGANYISVYLSLNLQPGEIRGIRAGVWKVRLVGEEIRDGRFHCWIERDDPDELGEFQGQKVFRFPSFFSSDSNVDSHSISSLGCGNYIIAVANYDAENNKINKSSSQGPTRDSRFKPDVAAPGTDIPATKGFSTDNSKWTEKTGTSMASPYVAGVIGLMLNANPQLTSAQCLGILQRTSRPLPGDNYEWKNDAGFGRIDADLAVKEAVSFSTRTDRT